MTADGPRILLIHNSTVVKGVLLSAEPQQLTVEIIAPYTEVDSSTPRLPDHIAQTGGYLSEAAAVTLSPRGTAAARTTLWQIYTGCLLFDRHRAELNRYYTALQPNEAAAYHLFRRIVHTYKTNLSHELVTRLIEKFLLV